MGEGVDLGMFGATASVVSLALSTSTSLQTNKPSASNMDAIGALAPTANNHQRKSRLPISTKKNTPVNNKTSLKSSANINSNNIDTQSVSEIKNPSSLGKLVKSHAQKTAPSTNSNNNKSNTSASALTAKANELLTARCQSVRLGENKAPLSGIAPNGVKAASSASLTNRPSQPPPSSSSHQKTKAPQRPSQI